MKTSHHFIYFTVTALFCILNSCSAFGQSAAKSEKITETQVLLSDSNELKPTNGSNLQLNGTGRACKPVPRSNPYSISRKNFNQLPADRKQFILDNSHKYTITD